MTHWGVEVLDRSATPSRKDGTGRYVASLRWTVCLADCWASSPENVGIQVPPGALDWGRLYVSADAGPL